MDNIKQFITLINKCETDEDIKKVVDGIVDKLLSEKKYNQEEIGLYLGGRAHNHGVYDFFITPDIKIKWSNWESGYHIYDRDYLYDFAKQIKKQNINENINPLMLSLFVGRYLEYYFKSPSHNNDYRSKILDEYSRLHAEEFYKKHNIPVLEEFTPEQQMDLRGDFPITVFKGTGCAKCSEWSTLAQNLLKVIGFDSACLFGNAMHDGKTEAHVWNLIRLGKDKNLLVDYAMGSIVYQDNKPIRIDPYYAILTDEEYEDFISTEKVISKSDNHYENGIIVNEPDSVRYYSVEKEIKIDELEQNNQSTKK